MGKFKVTCCSTLYTHYIVEAKNAEEAEENYSTFLTCIVDSFYEDNDEEVLETIEIEDEEKREDA